MKTPQAFKLGNPPSTNFSLQVRKSATSLYKEMERWNEIQVYSSIFQRSLRLYAWYSQKNFIRVRKRSFSFEFGLPVCKSRVDGSPSFRVPE